jgi:hypothetical protein
MVLFYCTFVALKARNLLTVQVHPNEFKLRREKRLFQAYVPPCWRRRVVCMLVGTDGQANQPNC